MEDKEKKDTTVTIRFAKKDHEKFKEHAENKGLTLVGLIRYLLASSYNADKK